MDDAAKGVKEAVPEQPTVGEAKDGASESHTLLACCTFRSAVHNAAICLPDAGMQSHVRV